MYAKKIISIIIKSALLIFTFATTTFSQNGFHLIATMSGNSTGDLFNVVSYIGDVNADGFDDVLVGAPHGNYAKLFYGGSVFDTIPDITFHCEQIASRFGWSLAGGKDVNGDGYPDVVIGAPYYWNGGKPFGTSQSGKIYVYFGGPNIDSLPDAEILVDEWYYNFGNSVTLGDMNNDGFADIIVGAYMDDIDAFGRVYIYFGGKQLHSTPYVKLEGERRNTFGTSVSYAGDVNKDGYGDLLIGAPQGLLKPYTGKAYLVYGGDSISLANSAVFLGDSSAHGQFGRVVAGLGDVNGDGFNDLGIMADRSVKIVTGGNINNATIVSADSLWWSFQTIAGLKDLNNDGFEDFALGIENRGNQYSGMAGVYLGGGVLDSLPNYKIGGTMPNDYFSCSVAGLGNINSGNFGEIIVAANNSFGMNGPGKVYIYSFDKPDGVYENGQPKLPRHFLLHQNYPNPFNPATVIRYQLAENSAVSLKIFDLLGREAAELVNERQEAGTYSTQWNASRFSSGVYFAVMRAGIFTATKKLVLMK